MKLNLIKQKRNANKNRIPLNFFWWIKFFYFTSNSVNKLEVRNQKSTIKKALPKNSVLAYHT
ncbi:hypothetical protein CP356_09010 [Lactobacillus sp. UMNPBX5]|nr:hypothetical protein CP356_09010 [Lactobacillus sp. UMNPBX5]